MFDDAIQSGVDYLSNASWNPFGNNYGGGGGKRYTQEQVDAMTPQEREDAMYDIFN